MYNQDEQNVPLWAAFHVACGVSEATVAVVGIMPIIQAHADENNTVVTILNKFQEMMNHLAQKHVVTVGDQPLYSRTKELQWSNPDKYDNVVVMMGGLHILFHFMKAIDQHMENAGLDDVWVESGAFAQNSTSAMVEGKAYYRPVRGHVMAYEALCRIKWKLSVMG